MDRYEASELTQIDAAALLEDQPDVCKANLRHEPLKAEPAFNFRARTAKIVIDDYNGLARPAEMEGAIHQSVLQPCRFLVTFDLLNRRLADVDDGQSFLMPAKDFLRQPAQAAEAGDPVLPLSAISPTVT